MISHPSPRPIRTLLFGGLLPVIAFSVTEHFFGILWGLVFGMAFGTGEIGYEWFTQRKVDTITWIGNGLILFMGGVSLLTSEGLWFKLQPAILGAAMGVFMLGSIFTKQPFLVLMASKQGLFEKMRPELRPLMEKSFRGLTVRLSIFFLLHAILATEAAIHWSTAHWALLKGVGFTVSMILYLIVEVVFLRRRIRKRVFR